MVNRNTCAWIVVSASVRSMEILAACAESAHLLYGSSNVNVVPQWNKSATKSIWKAKSTGTWSLKLRWNYEKTTRRLVGNYIQSVHVFQSWDVKSPPRTLFFLNIRHDNPCGWLVLPLVQTFESWDVLGRIRLNFVQAWFHFFLCSKPAWFIWLTIFKLSEIRPKCPNFLGFFIPLGYTYIVFPPGGVEKLEFAPPGY